MQRMRDQMEQSLSLLFRDEIFEENNNFPDENHLTNFCRGEPAPSIVAAICGALLACGLLSEGSVITAIRPVGTANLWKKAGIMDLMAGRALIRF